MKHTLALSIGLMVLAAAGAAGEPASPTNCALAVAEQVRVTAVTDGASFDLADRRHVRLAAIQAPMLSLARANITDWPLASEAEESLSKLILDRTVDLAFDRRSVDRHGDLLAHVFVGAERQWIQERLISDGFARVHTQSDAHACAQALLVREGEARKARRGIWTLPFYHVRTPGDLDVDIGTFQIAEGTVTGAVERRDRIFLNFGSDYRTDFTVTISPRDARRMAKAGINPLAWNAKRVRVRGWISLLNGPELELTHPEQIEILK